MNDAKRRTRERPLLVSELTMWTRGATNSRLEVVPIPKTSKERKTRDEMDQNTSTGRRALHRERMPRFGMATARDTTCIATERGTQM